MTTKNSKQHGQLPQDYQVLQQELDDIIDKLQSGSIEVDEALGAYERGSDIIKLLQGRLAVAQNKVTKLQKNRKI
jgi:exodeoxyribonuclease VII small subunit